MSQPAGTETTGRYLVLLDDKSVAAGAREMNRGAGIRFALPRAVGTMGPGPDWTTEAAAAAPRQSLFRHHDFRQLWMGDAVSHVVLPGIVVAFILVVVIATAGFAVRAVRWGILLLPLRAGIPFRARFAATVVGRDLDVY